MTAPVRLALVAAVALLASGAGCGKKAEPAVPAAPPASDKDRLQGVWAVEAIEFGDPTRKPRDGATNGRLHFNGDRLVVTIDLRDEYALAFDEAKAPKALLLTQLDRATGKPYRDVTKRAGAPDEVGEVHKQEWIYKFDGDKLVVALVRGGRHGERPKEFKASEEPQDVLVIRLKKTDETEPPPPRFAPTVRSTRK